MFIEVVQGIAQEIVALFLEMAPYLILGLSVSGLLHVLVSKGFVARHIGGHTLGSVFKAALFGVPLPLCSCGVIPTTVYMKDSGASKPALLSFLLSTPQTGVDSIAATYGMLGPMFAIFRPIAALLTGMLGGIVSIFTGKNETETEKAKSIQQTSDDQTLTALQKVKKMGRYAFINSLDDIAVQFVVGLIIAAGITYFVPDDFFKQSIFTQGFLGMILMIIVGIPLYICATSSIPIALALMMKGISPGAAYVFLMAGPATNAASLAVLGKVLGKKTTAVYLSVIIAGSLLFGMLLDVVAGITGFTVKDVEMMAHHQAEKGPDVFTIILSILFLGLLLASLRRRFAAKFLSPVGVIDESENTIHLKIDGMDCESCVAHVQSGLKKVENITNVIVNLDSGEAVINGSPDLSQVYSVIKELGYSAQEVDMAAKEVLTIEGMSCNHCKANVEKAITGVSGVSSVEVSLDEKSAKIEGDFSVDDVKKAVEEVGYSVV